MTSGLDPSSSVNGSKHPSRPPDPERTASKSFASVLAGDSDSPFTPKPLTFYKGFPSLEFTDEEIDKFIKPFRFTLIGKFGSKRPSMESLRKIFDRFSLSAGVDLGLIDNHHIMIKLHAEEDFMRIWLRDTWTFFNSPMKVSKWTPTFNPSTDCPILPIWISLPMLPIHFYDKSVLTNISFRLGKPLKMDEATTKLLRPSMARLCIEVDLSKTMVTRLPLKHKEHVHWQIIIYENVPDFCGKCLRLGHKQNICNQSHADPHKDLPFTSSGLTKNTASSTSTVNPLQNITSTTKPPAVAPTKPPVPQNPKSSSAVANPNNSIPPSHKPRVAANPTSQTPSTSQSFIFTTGKNASSAKPVTTVPRTYAPNFKKSAHWRRVTKANQAPNIHLNNSFDVLEKESEKDTHEILDSTRERKKQKKRFPKKTVINNNAKRKEKGKAKLHEEDILLSDSTGSLAEDFDYDNDDLMFPLEGKEPGASSLSHSKSADELSLKDLCNSGTKQNHSDTEVSTEKIKDRSNGTVAIDAYHRYKEDVGLMKDLGIDAYRFSISWSRILPKGKLSGGINEVGVEYYNNLINELVSKGIEPYGTIFHWDVPQSLEDEYLGFLSPHIVDDFRDYAELCFKLFGDRVKHWITLNEPWTFCLNGYSVGKFPPGRCSPWEADHCSVGDSSREPYLVAHNQLLAHAAAVQVYRNKYQASQKGKIGIALISGWFVPYNNKSKGDLDAVDRAIDFNFGWFMEPISEGHYPFNMQAIVGDRLPQFTKEQSDMLKGSFDFLGLNYYSSNYVSSLPMSPKVNGSYASDDVHVNQTSERDGKLIGPQAASEWLFSYPPGILELLLYIKNKYNNPTIYITENGVDEFNNYGKEPIDALLKDDYRINYYTEHLLNVQKAAVEGVNVRGFFAWSMFDNFEWLYGYTVRFGLYFVDFTTLKRYPKSSALWFKKFLQKN